MKLAALMERILGYSPIDRNDDFFNIGGDSLTAIEFVAALENEGYSTDVILIFKKSGYLMITMI